MHHSNSRLTGETFLWTVIIYDVKITVLRICDCDHVLQGKFYLFIALPVVWLPISAISICIIYAFADVDLILFLVSISLRWCSILPVRISRDVQDLRHAVPRSDKTRPVTLREGCIRRAFRAGLYKMRKCEIEQRVKCEIKGEVVFAFYTLRRIKWAKWFSHFIRYDV